MGFNGFLKGLKGLKNVFNWFLKRFLQRFFLKVFFFFEF